MPFVAPEDVGTTRRRSLSAHRRLKAWERTGGVCVVCESPIDGIRERWIVEHIRALELGGADELENTGPAREACGRAKTLDDNARTAKAKRQKIQHLGAAIPTQPFPGSRGTAFKRKINGRVILREEPSRGTRVRSSLECEASSKIPLHALSAPTHAACKASHYTSMVNEHRTERPMVTSRSNRDLNTQNPAKPTASATGEILPAIAPHLSFLFEDRPLLAGEKPELYDALLNKFLQQVKPQDAIEALWVKDIVDLIWKAKQFNRWRGNILDQARLQAAADLIIPVLEIHNEINDPYNLIESVIRRPSAEAKTIALGWIKGDKKSTASMEKHLEARGSTISAVEARAFQNCLSEIQKIDQMIALAENRRDALLREIERKRASLGQQLRAAADDITDVDPVPVGEGGPPSVRR
ncbi:hypothetical protein [Methylobacterium tarhaniae]|uniref:hypothetical protein n=1 Tax=Methylobacterium tarhaniae TaxID=1187852 RepID=UPI003D07A011